MSAEVLRKAAALMRERAEAARAGRWFTAPSSMVQDATLVLADWSHSPKRVATCTGSLGEGNAINADHIASWHPAVALAVADWLEKEADSYQLMSSPPEQTGDLYFPQAEAVARAYLGTDQ